MTTATATKMHDFSTDAVECFQRKEFDKAAMLLGECLLQEQTSERWNDWATARFFAGRSAEAEGGYRRALEMNSQNPQAAENMGALLTSQGRSDEAIPFLETAIFLAGEQASPALTQLLADSRMAAAMAQKDELARLNRSYNGLTRSLALQSLALDRALFRLTTLSLEVINATERMSKSIVDGKTARKTSNGR
jgi:tetratricopeptide (TPR) repeat protein